MTTVYLIRHAETTGNTSRAFHGITNTDISELGEKQLELLGKRMSEIHLDKIYASPLRRTCRTANAVRGDRDIPIIVDPQIQELSGGEWEMLQWSDILEKFPVQSGLWENQLHLAHPPGGESVEQVYNRMVMAIKRFVSENEGKTIAVCSHGAALLAYTCYLRGIPLEKIREIGLYDNTAITLAEYDKPDCPRIIFERDNSHLGTLSTLHKQNWSEYNKK
jgi:probable phosphoglycerate mutase